MYILLQRIRYLLENFSTSSNSILPIRYDNLPNFRPPHLILVPPYIYYILSAATNHNIPGMLGAKLVVQTNMKERKEWYYNIIADVSFVLLLIYVCAVPFAPNHKGSSHNGNPHRVGWGILSLFTLFFLFVIFCVVIKSRAVGSIPVVRNFFLFNIFMIFERCHDGSPVISNHPVHVDWLGNRERFVLLILFRFSSPPPILLPFSLSFLPLLPHLVTFFV